MNYWVYAGLYGIDKLKAMASYRMNGLGLTSKIFASIESVMGVNEAAIKGNGRTQKVSEARHVFCHIAYKHTLLPLQAIGGEINRHHATVINSKKVVESLYEIDSSFRKLVDETESLYLSL